MEGPRHLERLRRCGPVIQYWWLTGHPPWRVIGWSVRCRPAAASLFVAGIAGARGGRLRDARHRSITHPTGGM